MATAARTRGTVIVTGSSGFIGSALVKRLARRFRVVGFDRDTMALAACGFWILTRLGRPGASVRTPTLLLAGVLSIAASAAATELLGAAPHDRAGLLMGGSASVCPAYILALSGMAAPFVLWGARQFAPTRPRAAGAAAGLVAAGVAATLYGLHCQERTAAFVVVWYSLGIELATLLGGVLGGRLLRW